MIRKFLALFEGDWRKNIKLSWYESDKYDCEMSLICKWQKANEYENLLNFANEKLTQKYFELKHPLHNDISTRAVYSWHNGGVSNFVFMIDKEEKYPWLFVQIFRFINVFISLEGAFIVYEDLKGYAVDAVYRCSLHFKDELLPLLHYKDTEFALELANARPAHYYGMLLVHICNMRSEIFKKSINDNKIFFIPHEFEGKKSKGLPAIQPTLFPIIDKNKNFNALRGGGLTLCAWQLHQTKPIKIARAS